MNLYPPPQHFILFFYIYFNWKIFFKKNFKVLQSVCLSVSHSVSRDFFFLNLLGCSKHVAFDTHPLFLQIYKKERDPPKKRRKKKGNIDFSFHGRWEPNQMEVFFHLPPIFLLFFSYYYFCVPYTTTIFCYHLTQRRRRCVPWGESQLGIETCVTKPAYRFLLLLLPAHNPQEKIVFKNSFSKKKKN